MDARALIENIENYTVSGDSRSNQSSFRSPVQLRRRAFDSNFFFDEHTKRRNRTVGLSQSDQQHSTGSNKHKVRHITPPKVFQGVIFSVPDIRDDAPPGSCGKPPFPPFYTTPADRRVEPTTVPYSIDSI